MAKILAGRFLNPQSKQPAFENLEACEALRAQSGLYRSMSRAGVILANTALGLDPAALSLIKQNGDATAIYCAVDHSTNSHDAITEFQAFAQTNQPGIAALYGRLMSPKWTLQVSNGISASSLAILLGVEGGAFAFHHSNLACSQALRQARLDLRSGEIKFAIVCAAQSVEDPLMCSKYDDERGARRLSEGAGVLILENSNRDWDFPAELSDRDRHFGLADPLLQFMINRQW